MSKKLIITIQKLFYFLKNQVCVRFNPNQIDRIFNLNHHKKSIFNTKILILSIIGLLMSFAIKAQTIDSLKTKQAVEITPMPFKSSILENKMTDKKLSFEFPNNQKIIGIISCFTVRVYVEKKPNVLGNGNYNNITDILRKYW